jgi:hypothetical protein
MIEGLEKVLGEKEQPGLADLRELLVRLFGDGNDGRFVDQSKLKSHGGRVYRLSFSVGGRPRSVVVKRLKPAIAQRNELVVNRWLPAIGLDGAGPPLLGKAASRDGSRVWHVYEDLGQGELDPNEADLVRAQAAVDLVARIHTKFAGHPLLGEVRLHGGDLGIHFYETNVRDAIAALQAWKPQPAQSAVRDRMMARLSTMGDELPRLARAMAQLSGPETLVHGDLWPINIFVLPTGEGPRARLIDWDHAAVGPASYDLSTLLLRYPRPQRGLVLDLYGRAVAREGWRLPPARDLNELFETHEYARFANRVIWPAAALATEGAAWGFEELTEIERWFEECRPVLDAPGRSRGRSATPRVRGRVA